MPNISAGVDGGLSRGSSVRRPGSKDPHWANGGPYCPVYWQCCTAQNIVTDEKYIDDENDENLD